MKCASRSSKSRLSGLRRPTWLGPCRPGLRAWWLGHATVLLEIDGVRILTDPVLSQHASPFQFIGPSRLHAAPLAIGDLKNIDAVVISHDHFDHLDMDTIQALARGGTHIFVGLSIGAHLERWGVPSGQVHDMDWWKHAEVRGVTIHCAPARHYSGRKSMDNFTLWSSWMLKGPNHSAYFSATSARPPCCRCTGPRSTWHTTRGKNRSCAVWRRRKLRGCRS